MHVEIDHAQGHVVLRGERFEVRLEWANALNLGSILQHAAAEIEPPPPPGRCYRPAAERDR